MYIYYSAIKLADNPSGIYLTPKILSFPIVVFLFFFKLLRPGYISLSVFRSVSCTAVSTAFEVYSTVDEQARMSLTHVQCWTQCLNIHLATALSYANGLRSHKNWAARGTVSAALLVTKIASYRQYTESDGMRIAELYFGLYSFITFIFKHILQLNSLLFSITVISILVLVE